MGTYILNELTLTHNLSNSSFAHCFGMGVTTYVRRCDHSIFHLFVHQFGLKQVTKVNCFLVLMLSSFCSCQNQTRMYVSTLPCFWILFNSKISCSLVRSFVRSFVHFLVLLITTQARIDSSLEHLCTRSYRHDSKIYHSDVSKKMTFSRKA